MSVEDRVWAEIKGHKVMVFSKSYCPYCEKAKKALKKMNLKEGELKIWEIENEQDCAEIQAVLRKITKASSVPRVFINGKCIGGGDETDALQKNGQLAKLLA